MTLKFGKVYKRAMIQRQKHTMTHLLDESNPARRTEYGFVKAVKHPGSMYVVIHKGLKILFNSVVEAIHQATMMYFVLHVNYPSSAFAVHTFLGRMHGAMEKAKPKAGKAKKPDTHVDNPKLASVMKGFFP